MKSNLSALPFKVLVGFLGVIILVLLLVAGHFGLMRTKLGTAPEDFMVLQDGDGPVIVEFLSYSCGFCKDLASTMETLTRDNPNIKYIVRPVVFGDESTQKTGLIVLAAGLQGKFREFHDAVLAYPEPSVPDAFVRETAAFYNMDYDRLMQDARSPQIKKLAEDNIKLMADADLNAVPAFYLDGILYETPDDAVPTIENFYQILER